VMPHTVWLELGSKAGCMGRGRVADAKAAEVEAREAVRRQLQAITREYQSTQAATRAASQAVKCALWASRACLLLSVWQT